MQPTIPQFDIDFDRQNLEIFPQEIWQDPLVIFHGTASYHSPSIESKGIRLKSPFNTASARLLIRLLEREGIKEFDLPKNLLQWTTAQGLQHYIDHMEKGSMRLSFTYLSYIGTNFAFGPSKGGQSLHYIEEGQQALDHAIRARPELQDAVGEEVIELFNEVKAIRSSQGVVYAIRLPENLPGLELENGVIYSNLPIPAEWIIGKSILPEGFRLEALDPNLVRSVNTKKLTKTPQSIGILIERLSDPEAYAAE